MGLSAKQAADAVGMTKQGIIKSIRNGRLSAVKDDKGQWQIDPAELFRVYDAPKTVDHTPEATSSCWHTPQNTPDLHIINTELRIKLEAAEQRCSDLERQIHKAEERENQLIEVVQSQTRILEHKPPPSQQQRGSWFRWFRRE